MKQTLLATPLHQYLFRNVIPFLIIQFYLHYKLILGNWVEKPCNQKYVVYCTFKSFLLPVALCLWPSKSIWIFLFLLFFVLFFVFLFLFFIFYFYFFVNMLGVITLMQRSGEKTEKLTFARDEKKLYGAMSAKHRKGQPFNFAKLEEQQPPIREQPLTSRLAGRGAAQPPPPSPAGSKGPIP